MKPKTAAERCAKAEQKRQDRGLYRRTIFVDCSWIDTKEFEKIKAKLKNPLAITGFKTCRD